MELRAAGPSTPSFIQDEEGNIIDSRGGGSDPVQFVFEDILWTSEISREEAARRLEVTFYPFKKVRLNTPAQFCPIYLGDCSSHLWTSVTTC